MAKGNKANQGPGIEVARITVKVSPDTSMFKRDLENQLKGVVKAAENNPDASDVEVGADTKKLKKDVKAGVKDAAKSANPAKLKLDLSDARKEMDRFQRRSLGDLARHMSEIEKTLTLTGAGEELRRMVENAEKRAASRITKGPREGTASEVAEWRAAIREEVALAKALADGNKEAPSNWLGVEERRFRAHIRLIKLRSMARDKAAQDNAATAKLLELGLSRQHADNMDRLNEELKAGKAREKARNDETKAYQKHLDDQAQAAKDAEAERRRRALADPFGKKALSDLKKAWESADAALPLTIKGEEARRDLKDTVDKLERDVIDGVDIPIQFSTLRASEKQRVRREIDDLTKDLRKRVEKSNSRSAAVFAGPNLPDIGKMLPSFGSGVNLSGYLVILGAAVALAAPLLGLLSTAILAIPGMIAAIVTPLGAVMLGLDGIKKAGADSGLFWQDDDGKWQSGAELDEIKKEVSAAFADGLTPVFRDIKEAIPKLLDSMPAVAKGMTDMFKGFTDAVTSDEGIALFDQTVRNIGQAMTDAAPGMQSFTTGMLRLATSFTDQFPGLTSWFNTTGESFSQWVRDMTNESWFTGKSPMDEAFGGLGDTLKMLGDFVVDLGKEGMKFVQDPKKMQDFVGTLGQVADAIEALVALGNRLGPAWSFLNSTEGFLAGDPGDGSPPKLDKQGNKTAAQAGIDARKAFDDAFTVQDDSMWRKVLTGVPVVGTWLNLLTGSETGKELVADTSGITQAIPIIGSWLNMAAGVGEGSDEAALKVQELAVALKSLETPISSEGAPPLVEGIVGDLAKVAPAVEAAKTQLSGVLTPDTLGALSEQANAKPVEAPTVDLQQYEAGLSQMPVLMEQKGQETAAKAGEIPPAITAALGSMTSVGEQLGTDLAQGFANGIGNGIPWVTAKANEMAVAAKDAAKAALDSNSPSKVFEQIGIDTGKGFEIGMEGGFQPVLERAKGLAQQVSDIFEAGGDPTQALAGVSKQELKRVEATLDFEDKIASRRIKSLNAQAKLTDDKGLKEQLRQQASDISQQNEKIEGYKELLDLVKEFDGESGSGSGDDPFAKAASGLMKAPVDFAKATAGQFMSDIGVSGDGLISRAVTEGISYVFQIGSVDQAMAIKEREDSHRARAMGGR